MHRTLLSAIRKESGLSQGALAERAGTSRPTLSAYEHGRVSPTLETFERVIGAAGYRLVFEPVLHWRDADMGRGRVAAVPDRLPALRVGEALRRFDLPLHLEWSRRSRTVDLSRRDERARVYEVVLREGRSEDIASTVDGALLVDLWDDLVLPRALRKAWQPLIDLARSSDG